jgi:hypothetical protein
MIPLGNSPDFAPAEDTEYILCYYNTVSAMRRIVGLLKLKFQLQSHARQMPVIFIQVHIGIGVNKGVIDVKTEMIGDGQQDI